MGSNVQCQHFKTCDVEHQNSKYVNVKISIFQCQNLLLSNVNVKIYRLVSNVKMWIMPMSSVKTRSIRAHTCVGGQSLDIKCVLATDLKVGRQPFTKYLISACLPACLPAHLPIWLPACLPTYLPVCLLTYLPACPLNCLPACPPTACLSANLPASLSAHLPACLSAHPPACLPACPLTCLSDHLPTCLSAHLPACLSAHPLTCLPICLPACLRVCLHNYLSKCKDKVRIGATSSLFTTVEMLGISLFISQHFWEYSIIVSWGYFTFCNCIGKIPSLFKKKNVCAFLCLNKFQCFLISKIERSFERNIQS